MERYDRKDMIEEKPPQKKKHRIWKKASEALLHLQTTCVDDGENEQHLEDEQQSNGKQVTSVSC